MNESLTFLVHSHLAHQNIFLDFVLVFCARWLPWIVGVVFCVDTIGRSLDTPRTLVRVIYSLVVANGLIAGLKILFSQPRPFQVLDITPLFVYTDLGSFPSGHAFLFAVIATLSFWFKSQVRYVYAFSALLIGIARVGVGVHFVGDIVFGWIFGISLVYFMILLWNKKSR